MNNDEKILAALETLTTTVTQIQTEQQKTNQRLDRIENELVEIKGQQQTDTGTIELILSHVLTINKTTTEINDKINDVDSVTKVNTYDIAKLRAAK